MVNSPFLMVNSVHSLFYPMIVPFSDLSVSTSTWPKVTLYPPLSHEPLMCDLSLTVKQGQAQSSRDKTNPGFAKDDVAYLPDGKSIHCLVNRSREYPIFIYFWGSLSKSKQMSSVQNLQLLGITRIHEVGYGWPGHNQKNPQWPTDRGYQYTIIEDW